MSIKEQAEALGIDTVDADGKAIHHKTLEKLVNAANEPEEAPKVEESKPADGVNKDGFKAGQTLSSEELLKFMAEQRKKTGKLNPYAKVNKPRQRKTRSKIHANAADK